MKTSSRILVVAPLIGLMTLTGCGKTTVVDVRTTTTTIVGETTTLPSGSAADLLVKLRDRSFTLSNAIVDGTGKDTMSELANLWSAVTAQIPRTEFVDDAAHQLDLMQIAVDRKRPADADKAALHLEAIVNAELPKLGASGS